MAVHYGGMVEIVKSSAPEELADTAVAVELRRLREDLRREAERDRTVSWIDRIVAAFSFTLSWAGILGAYVLVFEERGASAQSLERYAVLAAVVIALLTVIPLVLIRAEERHGTASLGEADLPLMDDEISLVSKAAASRLPRTR